jgi:hypothetical protein
MPTMLNAIALPAIPPEAIDGLIFLFTFIVIGVLVSLIVGGLIKHYWSD